MLGNYAKSFFSGHPLLILPLLCLAICLGVFAVIVWRTLRAPDQVMRAAAALPLEDDA